MRNCWDALGEDKEKGRKGNILNCSTQAGKLDVAIKNRTLRFGETLI